MIESMTGYGKTTFELDKSSLTIEIKSLNSKNLDLSSIKIIASTGSPLVAESFEYVYNNLKKDVHLTSIAGGTDLVGCLVLGNLFSNVYKGEIQGQSLGIDIDIFNWLCVTL